MTDQIQRALKHVQNTHPEITHVVVSREKKMFFMTDDGEMPEFDIVVDVDLLLAAARSVEQVPAIFCAA